MWIRMTVPVTAIITGRMNIFTNRNNDSIKSNTTNLILFSSNLFIKIDKFDLGCMFVHDGICFQAKNGIKYRDIFIGGSGDSVIHRKFNPINPRIPELNKSKEEDKQS